MRRSNIIPDTAITGTLHLAMRHQGAKSEGLVACLTEADGTVWTLYRPDLLAADDPFFPPFDGKNVTITGDAEPGIGFFCVRSITILEDAPSDTPATASPAIPTPTHDKEPSHE